MPLPLAVIFDVDGVLVDSYETHFTSWQKTFEELSWPGMTQEQFAASFGRTSREILAELFPDRRLSDDQIKSVDDRKEASYRRLIEVGFPAMPSAQQLLDDLKSAGFLLAAGSSGPPANVELTLEKLQRRELFDAVVTGSDVERGKPDPQVFLVAAQRLGVPPHRCAVIVDAAPGIAAARAAGMLSIALVSTGRSHQELQEAHHLVDTLDQLSPTEIQRWIEDRSNQR